MTRVHSMGRPNSSLLALGTLAVLTGCQGAGAEETGVRAGDRSATFAATHEFSIEVPEGAERVQAWFAMPQEDDQFQTVEDWTVEAPYETRVVTDRRGNRFLYLETKSPPAGALPVRTSFVLTRQEVCASVDPEETRAHTEAELLTLAEHLEPSSQSVIDDDTRALAEEITGGEKNPVVAARLIYDWTLDRIEYHVKDPKSDAEKTMGSTGVGSSRQCLEQGCGNCTDFHSLFASISRSAGIPTRAVYGSFFKGPLDGVDKDQSYHCWLEFHAPDIGWIPLDVAVADIFVSDFTANEHSRPRANLTVADGYSGPDAKMVEYYFGNLEERRVTWHRGRDLVLDPPQSGGPLNWLTTAYVEVDGQPASVSRKLTYEGRPR